MKVCIVSDDLFFSLQKYALNLGHEVYVYVPGLTKRLDTKKFAPFPLSPRAQKKLHQVLSVEEAWATNADIYFVGTQSDDYAYEELKFRASLLPENTRPVICGYDRTALLLERDRALAATVNNTLFADDNLRFRVPAQHSFTDRSAAADFLLTSKNEWVVKQHATSPLERDRNRTVVASTSTKRAVAKMVEREDESNPWFEEDGSGGCIMERRVRGLEVSFGAWFNGQSFVGPTYLYEEHKGAWPGSLGNIMTGEVGTTMTWYPFDDTKRICQILRRIEPLLRGHCCGMVDINTILDDEGTLWCLEYTVRFGRPTLEMQLAGPGVEEDMIRWWYAASQIPAVNNAQDATGGWSERSFQISVGVTVFSYGVPLVAEDEHRYPIAWPANNPLGGECMQLFARYSSEDKTWMAVSGERQFLVVGTSFTPDQARERAYAVLQGYEAHELVWRPDVGLNTKKMLSAASEHDLI